MIPAAILGADTAGAPVPPDKVVTGACSFGVSNDEVSVMDSLRDLIVRNCPLKDCFFSRTFCWRMVAS